MNLLFAKQLRDSGLPADVLVSKFKEDLSFALRRGTIAQVTTHHALDGCAWLRLPSAPSRMRSSLPSTDEQAGWLASFVSWNLPKLESQINSQPKRANQT